MQSWPVGSTRFWRRLRRALVERRAKFNEVLKKVPEGFRGEPGQVQRGSEEGSSKFRWKKCENSLLLLLGIPPKLILEKMYEHYHF